MEIESYSQMLARRRLESAANAAQLLVLGFLVMSFFVLILFFSPHQDHVLALVGLALLALAYATPGLLSDQPSVFEPIPVVLIASLGLFMPPAAHPPISGVTALASTIGLLATESLWALRRYPVEHPNHTPTAQAVKDGIKAGLSVALGIASIAAVILGIRAVVGYKTEEFRPLTIVLLFVGYLLGGVLVGALSGVLRHLLRWPLGTMFVGIIGGIIVYTAVMPAAVLSMQGSVPHISLTESVLVACACGVFVGPPAALGRRYMQV